MSGDVNPDWVVLSPPFPKHGKEHRVLRQYATHLSRVLETETEPSDLDSVLTTALEAVDPDYSNATLRAELGVLTDLARQKWSIRVTGSGTVEVRRPVEDVVDPMNEKARIRAQELVKRDEQLREPATRAFIKKVESKSIHSGQFVSIYSLMRDGREFADSLRCARKVPRRERASALRDVVDPYLQVVDTAEHCQHTGLRLQDIWRYFRHTWTNQYTNIPGRTIAFLVRDRARGFHPVIGIGALSSPIVQIRERDAWIGWHFETFMELASETPSAELGLWLIKTVDKALAELFADDFFEDGILAPADIRVPKPKVLDRLTDYGRQQRELHKRLTQARDLKRAGTRRKGDDTEEHWRLQAQTHLYRSKRALSLAGMLRCRMVLQECFGTPPTSSDVHDLLASSRGRQIVKKILRKAKADRIGIAVADITVCGAVQPYSPVLGGKLVSMLAVSPEILTAYRDKYAGQESVIASSMAGRPIIRPSQLAFVGTTSLYGVGSSQYNRLRMPAARIGGKEGEHLEYIEIGKSQAYGTSHFSSNTVRALVDLVQQSSNGRRVNSIFGEGVSPKLRKIREGLDALNLPADALLKHGRRRIVYGVPLVRNLREFLLGMDSKPEYMFDLCAPGRSTGEIGSWWIERWLSKRIESDEVLSRVEQHTLIHPIRHGARVVLPRVDDDQKSLFDDQMY